MNLKSKNAITFWVNSVNLIIALVLIMIISSLFLRFRIDLTKNRIHSLSPATNLLIRNLSDIVVVKVYLTSELPPEAKVLSDNLKTVLSEYQNLNKQFFKVEYYDPNKNNQAKEDAAKYGIQPLQFSSVKSDKLEVLNGYFGLVLVYGNNQETLPVAGDVGNLEYFLNSGIKKLTTNISKEIILTTGNGEVDSSVSQIFTNYLQNNYKVSLIDLAKDESLLNKNGLLILAGPTTAFNPKSVEEISQWIEDKKSTLILLNGVNVDDSLKGTMVPSLGIEEVLKNKGIQIENNLVLDNSSSIASFRTQSGGFMIQYPFWVQVQAANIDQNLPPLSGIQTLLFPWSSALTIEGKAKAMIYSSQNSWTSNNMNELSPVTKWQAGSNLGRKVLAAINTENSRLAVIGNVNFIKDQFATNNQENLVLALNLIDYLLQDDSLLSIRTKTIQNPPLMVLADSTKSMIRYSSLGFTILILLVIGVGVKMVRIKINNKYA